MIKASRSIRLNWTGQGLNPAQSIQKKFAEASTPFGYARQAAGVPTKHVLLPVVWFPRDGYFGQRFNDSVSGFLKGWQIFLSRFINSHRFSDVYEI